MAGFEIIPVIDLMGGLVVHARGGERDSYRPLTSPLAASAEPAEVVRGLLRLHPFRSLYIADLDAIRKQGQHSATVRALHAEHPDLDLWVDAGFANACPCGRLLGSGIGSLVLGSESQKDTDLLASLAGESRLVLSLDYKGPTPLGPPDIFARADLWPERLIVMTLAAVGGTAGPDLARLAEVLGVAGQRRVYAAGGVRDASDLRTLRELGCAGVLVASALHDGRLGAKDLARTST
jgi:phosphoribosylformimino-5-aminoimidazole carboxamide ribotide isomerase